MYLPMFPSCVMLPAVIICILHQTNSIIYTPGHIYHTYHGLQARMSIINLGLEKYCKAKYVQRRVCFVNVQVAHPPLQYICKALH